MRNENHYYEQHMLKAFTRTEEGVDDLAFLNRVDMQANERLIMIGESYEAVRAGGGVSRSMIEPVHGMLPYDMPLNSYTSKPTQTNHGMALESLALGVKIAIGVGLVAVLGVAIWYMMRAKGHSIPSVKDKRLEAADSLADIASSSGRINDTLNKNADMFNAIFNRPDGVDRDIAVMVASGNIEPARDLLIKALAGSKMTAEDLEKNIDYASENMPGLFVAFGKIIDREVTDRAQWTNEHYSTRLSELKDNFSESRYKHLIEVRQHLADSSGRSFAGLPNEADAGSKRKDLSEKLDAAKESIGQLAESAEVASIVAENESINSLTAMMLGGKYTSILDGNPNIVKATDDFLAIIDRNVVKVLTKAVSGSVRSAEADEALAQEIKSGAEWKETAAGYHKAVDAWCSANHLKLATANDYSSVWTTFNNLLESGSGKTAKGKVAKLSKIISKDQEEMARDAQEKITTILADLDLIKSKVEKSGIPEKLATAARKAVDDWKPVMQLVEVIFHIVQQEIVVLNLTGNIKGSTIAKRAKAAKAAVRTVKKAVVDEVGPNSEAALILDHIDTSSFAAFDKVMSDAMGGK